MNIYKIDFGWQGALVCVAKTKDEALGVFYGKILKDWHEPDTSEYYYERIEEFPIDSIVETDGE